MNQLTKTSIFVGVAAVLVVLACYLVPPEPVPEIFKDQGQAFFKSFAPSRSGPSRSPASTRSRASPSRSRWNSPAGAGRSRRPKATRPR